MDYDVSQTQAVSVAKRALNMLLPALMKLATDAPDDMKVRVAVVAGQVLQQLAVEYSWQHRYYHATMRLCDLRRLDWLHPIHAHAQRSRSRP